jgi:hypothetical protein
MVARATEQQRAQEKGRRMSEGHLLTDAERERFIRYLRGSADSSKQLLKAMGSVPWMELVSKKYKTEIACFEFVARWMENAASTTIGAGS